MPQAENCVPKAAYTQNVCGIRKQRAEGRDDLDKNSVPKAANVKGNTINGGGTPEIVLLKAKKCVLQAENCVPKAAYTQKTLALGQKQRAEGRTSFYSRKKHAAGRKLCAEGRVLKKPQAAGLKQRTEGREYERKQ